jgi:hypothetical protein
MRWAGRIAYMEDRRGAFRASEGKKLRERDHLENPDVDGRIILRLIFKKWDGKTWAATVSFVISFLLSVRPSAWKNSPAAGRWVMIFELRQFVIDMC